MVSPGKIRYLARNTAPIDMWKLPHEVLIDERFLNELQPSTLHGLLKRGNYKLPPITLDPIKEFTKSKLNTDKKLQAYHSMFPNFMHDSDQVPEQFKDNPTHWQYYLAKGHF